MQIKRRHDECTEKKINNKGIILLPWGKPPIDSKWELKALRILGMALLQGNAEIWRWIRGFTFEKEISL